MNNNGNKISVDTRIKVFMWIIGIVIALTVGSVGYTIRKLDDINKIFNHSITEIMIDIGKIQTDIGWIKDKLK